MPAPTNNDWDAFSQYNNQIKARTLYLYLCEGYNMKDVTYEVGFDDPRQVSGITRCYGLDGKNAGKLGRLGVTEQDMLGFVKTYPGGAEFPYGLDIMYEYFSTNQGYADARQHYGGDSVQYSSNTAGLTADEGENDKLVKLASVAFVVCLVILFVVKFGLGWGWIISIIVFFISYGLSLWLISKILGDV